MSDEAALDAVWDAAVDASARKAMALQAGFRGLLKSARATLQKTSPHDEVSMRIVAAEVSQGEALVGALGDVIRNIAAMKGNRPR